MLEVEVEGLRLHVQGQARDVEDTLERAVGAYLERNCQPNHVEVMSRRVDGWGRRFKRYDVYAETDDESGRGRRHRYFDVTIYN